MTKQAPKLFISYCHTTQEHKEWVLNLATELRENGVDVILDLWELEGGNDIPAFMETMVTDTTMKKVALICDRAYVQKADGRSGGVGAETQIITPKLYKKVKQDKFVAVVTERDDNDELCLPAYYGGRVYIDMSSDDRYVPGIEQILRWVHNKPLHKKPPIGKVPEFLEKGGNAPSSNVARLGREVIQSVRAGFSPRKTAASVSAFFNACTAEMESFRVEKSTNGHFDDKVVESIKRFLPRRDEIVGVFLALAQQGDDDESPEAIHGFLESLLPYTYPPEGTLSYRTWDFDNFKFIAHELFLYAVACYIKHRRFTSAAYLMEQGYYDLVGVQRGESESAMAPFRAFRRGALESLIERGNRIDPRRLSLRADMLKKQSTISGLGFDDLITADFVLYLRGQTMDGRSWWWPEILFYADEHSVLKFFARCQSKKIFDRAKVLLGVESKKALGELLDKIESESGRIPEWGHFTRANPRGYLGYDQIATRP